MATPSQPITALAATGLAVLMLAFSPAGEADAKPGLTRQFRAWIDKEIVPKARRRGISKRVLKASLGGLTPDLSLPDLQQPGTKPGRRKDYSQSEFANPARYFKEGGLNTYVKMGRQRLKKWAGELDRIERRYGVSKRILVAIWARESGFGRAAIPHNAFRILATQAFMGHRKAMFVGELLAALEIVQRGDIGADRMKSSWAGALGQPQFMPSKFLKYAVDFDGDGRRDIWNSVPDTLASIAHFLKQHGWDGSRDWGFEAEVPRRVSCALEGPEQGRKVRDWAKRGVTRVAGREFPAAELAKTGYLMMPVGRYGPAFIATDNFYVIKSYNESDAYALYIGHLADRLGRNRPFVASWRGLDHFSRGAVQRMQERLIRQGYDVGGADGLVGFKTRTAIGLWQEKHGMRPTCFPNAKLLKAVR